MKKRRFLGIALPILSSVAIVGAGFSAWYFGSDQDQSASVALDIQVTDAHMAGNAFVIKPETLPTITFDQKEITYSENAFVGFGYVAETFETDNFTVTLSNTSGEWAQKQTNGTSANENTSILTDSEVTITMPTAALQNLNFSLNSKSFTVYYVIYTNIVETAVALDSIAQSTGKSALVCAIKNSGIKDSEGTTIDFSSLNSEALTGDLTVANMPELKYAESGGSGSGFDTSCIDSYKDLKTKAENSQLKLTATFGVNAPV